MFGKTTDTLSSLSSAAIPSSGPSPLEWKFQNLPLEEMVHSIQFLQSKFKTMETTKTKIKTRIIFKLLLLLLHFLLWSPSISHFLLKNLHPQAAMLWERIDEVWRIDCGIIFSGGVQVEANTVLRVRLLKMAEGLRVDLPYSNGTETFHDISLAFLLPPKESARKTSILLLQIGFQATVSLTL